MRLAGRVYRLPDPWWADVNTDVILPAAHLRVPEEELAAHTFGGAFDDFQQRVASRPILVAGPNFGCGSSREQAPKGLLRCGVRAVIAPSFGNIFYRNAINLGLAAVKLGETEVDLLHTDDEVSLHLDESRIYHRSRSFSIEPFSGPLLAIIQAGGLLRLLASNPAALGYGNSALPENQPAGGHQ